MFELHRESQPAVLTGSGAQECPLMHETVLPRAAALTAPETRP
ncbi:hypothetical protein [Streptomyces sp. NBC_00987]|nr:hypothetical protein OG355_40990 [Streptomyces sp. NBC_00987]